MMNIRERMEAFWSGERPDQIPYTIYQNEWRHTAHDPAWQGLYDKGLGVTWNRATFKETWPHVEVDEKQYRENGRLILRRTLRTPIGDIYETYIDGWHDKYYLETATDYAVMTYIVKNAELEPAYDQFLALDKEIAPHGIPLVALGRTPFQVIQVDYAGLQNFAYHLFDYQSELQELYEARLVNYRRAAEIVAAGPGRFVSVLENFTAESLGPKRFAEFLVPVYNELFPMLRSAGKIVGTHYDGRLASCQHLIAEAPIDLIESFTTHPEGDMTLTEARQVWPDKLLWSNINVACYYLPPSELRQLVLDRVAEAAPDGKRLAFEVSEQYPDNWPESLPIVLDALAETRV
ncbi:MAG: hypothetical protein H6658_09445 [Ardenticatenaceae bacterium]|nr:hypothetical protein [Ardenticatenaceae bacterium]